MTLRNLLARADRWPSWLKATVLLGAVALIGVFDYLTGSEISFSVFYVLPVGIAAWWNGLRVAYGVAVLAALAWYAAELWAGYEYAHPFIAHWNGLSPFLLLLIILHLLHALQGRFEQERARADRDPLTGLLNLHAFQLQAEAALAHARRRRNPLAAAFFDLDNFKTVNDREGHEAGNRVLRSVAEAMRRVFRESDLLARVGGDEFAVVLTDTTRDGAVAVIAELHNELRSAMAGLRSPVTFSIGLVIFAVPPWGVQDMLRMADQLMYEVKRSGKDAIRIAEVTAP